MTPTTDAAANQRRDDAIQRALAEGRIHHFSAPRWRVLLDQDEAGTTQLIASLTPVPLAAAMGVAAFSAPLGAVALVTPERLSSDDPAAVAAFRGKALANARRQEELARIEAAEAAETLRGMRALGFGV